MTLPTLVAAGTSAGGIGDVTPTIASEQAGDLLITSVEHNAGETVLTPSGWTILPGSPFLRYDNAGSQLSLFYRFATSGAETDPTITDPGDHAYGRVFTFRGVSTLAPFHAIACAAHPGTGTAYVLPGLVTFIADCLVLVFAGWGNDQATEMITAATNTSLANFTERSDEGTTQGGGGGVTLYTGEKATAGKVELTTITTAIAYSPAAVTIALAPGPSTSQTVAGNVTIDGVAAANGGAVEIWDTVEEILVGSTTIAGAGAFTVDVPYGNPCIAVYDDGTNRGVSAAATPESGTFDIEIFTEGAGGGTTFPQLAIATTPALIRDRMRDVLEALVPSIHAGVRFVEFRNEGDADFIAWAEANPQAALRRFQVRDNGTDDGPAVSNTDIEEREVTITIIVAYPQTSKLGADLALDRDDAMDADRFQIDYATGMCGRSNFASPYPDACWRKTDTPERLPGKGVDFLVITHTLTYQRQRA